MLTTGGRTLSTSWVQNMRKADLEAELSQVGQPIVGSRDELRKRFKDYVRNNPEHFANVIWVYQLSPKVLKEELREAPLSEIGEWGELARRLAEHVRGYLTDYSSIIEQGVSSRARSEDPIKAVVESRKSPPLEIVRKWNLKFGPQDSVYSFLERLDELKSAYNVLGGDMLLAIPELLKGSVVLWYRNNHSFLLRGKIS